MIKKILVRPKLFAQLSLLSAATRALYDKALQRFVNEGGHGLNLEKLQGGLYSIRVNQQARLILTPQKRNDEQVWLWIETLEDHKYQELLKKPNSWLSNQIIKTQEMGIELSSHSEPELTSDVAIELEPETGISYQNQQFIVLNSQQKNMQQHPLPMIISGAPGSGKTSVALFMLVQFIHARHPDCEYQHLLYLAQSESLVNYMRHSWQAIVALEFPELSNCEVAFKTPLQLYNETLVSQPSSSAHTVTQAHYEQFMPWMSSYIKKHKRSKIAVGTSVTDDWLLQPGHNAEIIYQEFRTISGYLKFEDYNKLVGSRFSLFTDPEARQWLWCAYHDYIDYLSETQQVDLSFHPIHLPAQMDFLIADEAADFSGIQLRSLPTLVRNNQLVLCIGDHQRVLGNESVVPFVKHVFWQENGKQHKVHHEILRSSYRNPTQVTLLANAALQLKFKANNSSLSRDHSELSYITSVIKQQGDIYWLANEQELIPLINDRDNADFAVITCSEFLKEAQEKFGLERVLTPEGIKGLEYKHILIYRLLEQPGFQAANQIIGDHCELKANPDEFILPKNTEGTIVHNRIFNELFVAITRAQQSVSVFQPEMATIRYIRTALMQFIKQSTVSTTHTQAIPTHSSTEDWQHRERQLAAHQHNEQAQAISERLSKKTKNPPTTRTQTAQGVSQASSSSAKKPIANKTTASVDTHLNLINRILGGDFSAIKPLLKQQEALNYLFKTLIRYKDDEQFSLFEWFRMTPHLKELFKATHTILKELEAINNPTTAQKAEISTFMELIHFDPSDTREETCSLISGVKESTTLHKKISRFIAQYKVEPKPTAVLTNQTYLPDAHIPDIPQMPKVDYQSHYELEVKSGATRTVYMRTLVAHSSPWTLPAVFLPVFRQEQWEGKHQELVIKLDPAVRAKNSSNLGDIMSLRDLLSNKDKQIPTPQQLIQLFGAIGSEVDKLDLSLTFWPSLDSIFIRQLHNIGTNQPLSFKFCPASVRLTSELPPGASRVIIHHRQLASMFLLIAAESNRLDDRSLIFNAQNSLNRIPALTTIFLELWLQTLRGTRLAGNQLLLDSSPNLRYLSENKDGTININQIAALLTVLPSVTNYKTLDTLIANLYRLLTTSEGRDREYVIGVIVRSIENISDTLRLDALPEKTQKTILKLFVLLFEHLHHNHNYTQLRLLQQRLVASSITPHLFKFNSLPYEKSCAETHISAIKILIWLGFRCDMVSLHLFKSDHALAMAIRLLLAIKNEWLEQKTGHEYIIMLLILSDFTVWLEPNSQYTYGIEQLWQEIAPESFITYALPCYFNTLSDTTTTAVTKKLEAITIDLISSRGDTDVMKERHIEQCLNYLLFLQWNGEQQLNAASYISQQEANRAAMVFKKPGHSLLINTPAFPHHLAKSNPLQNMFDYLIQVSLNNSANHQQQWKQFKEPITETDLAQVVTIHAEPMDTHYLPCPDSSDTHCDKKAAAFIVPNNGMFQSGSDSSRIQGISTKNLAQQNKVFIPTTISTITPMYTVRAHDVAKGTRAMFELHIDTVHQPNLVIGITWDRERDKDASPGKSPTSLGFVVNTGCVRYYSATGKRVEVPYARPSNPGDKVALGIANNSVYLAINGLFYPLIQDLKLPAGDIYPLIRINDPQCQLIINMMNCLWSNELNTTGTPIHSTSNEVANSQHKAHENARACPHSHTFFDSDESLSDSDESLSDSDESLSDSDESLSDSDEALSGSDEPLSDNESFYKVTFDALIQTPQLIATLPQSWQRTLLLILLAHEPCEGEHCHAQDIFTKLKTVPANDYHMEESLAPINLANLLGLEQLVEALSDVNTSQASRYEGRFFNRTAVFPADAPALKEFKP